MPLVFVHGINTRRGDTDAEKRIYDNRDEARRLNFRVTSFSKRVSDPDGLAVFQPYWGDLGAKFARNLASLPKSGIQQLAVGDAASEPLLELTAASLNEAMLQESRLAGQPLLTLARSRTLGTAIDLLFAGTAAAPVSPLLLNKAKLKIAQEAAAEFARRAEEYAASNSRPGWLQTVQNDEEFLDQLAQEVGTAAAVPQATGTDVLGFGDDLKKFLRNGAEAIGKAATKIVSVAVGEAAASVTGAARGGFVWLSGFSRPAVSTFIGRFMGDIFTYMENRQPIVDLVLADIDKAVAAKRPGDEELILVGHSFGGIILYDILSKFRPELQCNLFVTVGSQVALFAEIDRLADKDGVATAFAVGPASVIPRRTNIARWINIFDRTDILGFGTMGVFSGAWDLEFETDALPLLSHGAYFDTIRFHARMSDRASQAFASPTGTDNPLP